jgi:diacylglycerol kinase family enzyme
VRVDEAHRDARVARKRAVHRVVREDLAVDAVVARGGDGPVRWVGGGWWRQPGVSEVQSLKQAPAG